MLAKLYNSLSSNEIYNAFEVEHLLASESRHQCYTLESSAIVTMTNEYHFDMLPLQIEILERRKN